MTHTHPEARDEAGANNAPSMAPALTEAHMPPLATAASTRLLATPAKQAKSPSQMTP
jgi:hypothetical protein